VTSIVTPIDSAPLGRDYASLTPDQEVVCLVRDITPWSPFKKCLESEGAKLTSSLIEFETKARESGNGVVYVQNLRDEDIVWLRRLCRRMVTVDIILIFPLNPQSVRSTEVLRGEGARIVWEQEGWPKLREQLRMVSESDSVTCLSRVLSNQVDSALIRRGLLEISGGRPPKNVAVLAGRVKVTPEVLTDHWRRVFPRSQSPKGLIGWVLLLRAVSAGQKANRQLVAMNLGIHPRTLERLAVRLVGVSLGEALQAQKLVEGRFLRFVTESLLKTESQDSPCATKIL